MLKFVSHVSSPASQERSEGGLQPDGDASKGSPNNTGTTGKKENLNHVLYIFSEMVKRKENIKEHVFLSPVL